MTALWLLIAVVVFGAWITHAMAAGEEALHFATSTPNLESNIDRPLRYRPDGTDFVIENGPIFFNRALYGGNSAFRVEAGDKPEFVLYLPGRGGNLRLGLRSASGSTKWLHDAASIESRYRPGGMLYTIRDPLLGADGSLHVEAYALAATEGLILRIDPRGDLPAGVELVWAFGGVNGQRGARDGDIGTERVPISEWFQLQPDFCTDNTIESAPGSFTLKAKAAIIFGRVGGDADAAPKIADAASWHDAGRLVESEASATPIVAGRIALKAGAPRYVSLQRLPGAAITGRGSTATTANLAAPYHADDLSRVFDEAAAHFKAIRERIAIDTPDPYLNAATGALAVAADAVWDDGQNLIMHGAIAWRMKYVGWRGPYALDALAWHDRARTNMEFWLARQNTGPIPETHAPPEEETNLARMRTALHTNGDITNHHYDMNVGFFDAIFRHLLWTGDKEFAEKLWPSLERHLAWERRSFRRTFGPDSLPLYENYASTWASDDLYYSGGGTAHQSAYNLFHNRMAARIARWIGKDPAPYEKEADLIQRGMRELLWIRSTGHYAEYKDLLGNQRLHESSSLWNVYHTVDSQAVDPIEAWQLTRYVDQMPHLPVRGPGVPNDRPYAMIPTTTWMPYSWSINNVCMNEDAHMALAYFQAGRHRQGQTLLKSCVLTCMFMGIAPGNVGTMTYHDVYRREAQRDFADASGTLSRAFIEGLFGIRPDAIAGELRIEPAFPEEWDRASIRHPGLSYAWKRTGQTDAFTVESRLSRPMSLRLVWPALAGDVGSVTVNGAPAKWEPMPDAVGFPRIVITAPQADRWQVEVQWKGQPIATPPSPITAQVGDAVTVSVPAGVTVQSSDARSIDPQKVLAGDAAPGASARIADNPGAHTVFVPVKQGDFTWLMPIDVVVASPASGVAKPFDWSTPRSSETKFESVDLSGLFNLSVTEIFKQEYRSPRSPGVSMSIPKQGIGAWAGHVNATASIDDAGLRNIAAKHGGKLTLPNGVLFATPTDAGTKNIAFTSLWDNFPRQIDIPLTGKAKHVYLLMAGSTNFMQSRFDNGEVIVTYTDGAQETLTLNNPINWWPIEQDFFIDDYQFRRPGPLPPRVDLKTGKVRLLDPDEFKGKGRAVDGGAATVLEMPLDGSKELKSLTVRTTANDVVIGLMSATLER